MMIMIMTLIIDAIHHYFLLLTNLLPTPYTCRAELDTVQSQKRKHKKCPPSPSPLPNKKSATEQKQQTAVTSKTCKNTAIVRLLLLPVPIRRREKHCGMSRKETRHSIHRPFHSPSVSCCLALFLAFSSRERESRTARWGSCSCEKRTRVELSSSESSHVVKEEPLRRLFFFLSFFLPSFQHADSQSSVPHMLASFMPRTLETENPVQFFVCLPMSPFPNVSFLMCCPSIHPSIPPTEEPKKRR